MAPNAGIEKHSSTKILKRISKCPRTLPLEVFSKTNTSYNISRKSCFNLISLILLHLYAIHAICVIFQYCPIATIFFNICFSTLCGLGVTAGAHRLWAHRAYKVKLPLKLFLILLQTAAAQGCIIEWVRDHRVHHAFSETDADPHNANRGFFFSHMGWLFVRKHPEVIRQGSAVSLDDLYKDRIVRWQKHFYFTFAGLFGFALPILLPIYCWNECLTHSLAICMLRYVISLHITWSVNSVTHLWTSWGHKRFDYSIMPVDIGFVSSLTLGEGFHNYHHAFPYDYRTSELGWTLNLSAAFIDLMAFIGQAYDLRKADPHAVVRRRTAKGDLKSGNDNDQICDIPDESIELFNRK